MIIDEYAKHLYNVFNYKTFPKSIDSPNQMFDEFLSRVYEDFNQAQPQFNRIEIETMNLESPSEKNIMIGYSGGKDSVALTSFLTWETDFKPFAFYVDGINKSYGSERNGIDESLDAIDPGIRRTSFKFDIKRNGKCEFIENPFKNFLIMTWMAVTAFNNNICNISLGEYPGEPNNFYSAYSDNFDVIMLYVKALRSVFPQLKYLKVFNNEVEALFYLVLKEKLIGKWQSCILPDYRRVNVRKANIKHFPEYENTFLKHPGKCLGCYKCLQEYFILCLFNKMPTNKEVMRKCGDAWRRQYAKDNGVEEKSVTMNMALEYMLGDLPKNRLNEISNVDNLISDTKNNIREY